MTIVARRLLRDSSESSRRILTTLDAVLPLRRAVSIVWYTAGRDTRVFAHVVIL